MSDDPVESEDSGARRRRASGSGDEPGGTSPSGGGADAKGDGSPAAQATDKPRTPVTQQIGRVVVLLLLILFGVFAASNAQPVDFSWVFGETQATRDAAGEISGGVPLIVLLLISFAIGAIVGGLLAWQAGRSRRAPAPPAPGTDSSRPRRSRG